MDGRRSQQGCNGQHVTHVAEGSTPYADFIRPPIREY
jgi:hypothetical protein